MGCSLQNKLKKEHASMVNPKLAEVIFECPVVGKQICLWCCLHIADAADPLKRGYTLDMFPDMVKVEEESGRDLDSIWETCSRCHVRA